jgi:putative tryptophan/tyrosine transport system substrate-binding protein
MRRREFIAGLGAAAWPVVSRAQQPAMPVVGFLGNGPNLGNGPQFSPLLAAFSRGLSEIGYVEGRNVTIEYRFAEGKIDQLPVLAADLVRRNVAVIVAQNTQTALAAKAATQTIPIVFQAGSDPVEIGLVSSLNRPSGNVTGITVLNTTIASKRFQLLHEAAPAATSIAFLVNRINPALSESEARQVQPAAHALGVHLLILSASEQGEIEAAFATLAEQRIGALLVSADPIFVRESNRLVALAAQHALPTMYQYRESTAAGGLMSYGASITSLYRQLGVYVARILKGDKPADLPVEQAAKFEFVINLKTAKALGLTIPETLLATADEVIQ